MTRRLVAAGIALVGAVLLALSGHSNCRGDTLDRNALERLFAIPPAAAKTWTFWYWMHGCVSAEGIDADLDAMADVGLGGAYLMTIKGPLADSPWPRPVDQLSPEWRRLVRYAAEGARRRGLQLAFHACDGFATAGGPWITPELAMQRLVGTVTRVQNADKSSVLELPRPESGAVYYRDIAVIAFAAPPGFAATSAELSPQVTTSLPGFDASFLPGKTRGENDLSQSKVADVPRLRLEDEGWFQYEFSKPFTCRSIVVTPDGANVQAHRLCVKASDDGVAYRPVAQLAPPRHGWQSGAGSATHSIPTTTARFFRFAWGKEGTEPGSEDLDAAKWSPVLKVRTVELLGEPRIHHCEGKSGSQWRVSGIGPNRGDESLSAGDHPHGAIDLTARFDGNALRWDGRPGDWVVMRLGHAPTNAKNETGGGGRGLECDKLNAAAVELQFDRWYGMLLGELGPELTSKNVAMFHVDSWECGSQDWTPGMLEEFRNRRGYDPVLFLPALAGFVTPDRPAAERFLRDWRRTIDDLLQERFFGTLARLAHARGCQFSAECTAPTMAASAMRHFAAVDVPMGEFWLRSPTHDKPNDVLDAISAAHVYGKRIVQAEAFTQLRMQWDEDPALLKPLADRQFAAGVNRLVMHVFVHNPWIDRRPGMTLDNIGLLFQRGQTWWPAAKGWVDYLSRCEALLQCGEPVVDIAVFVGEEIPNRAILPERLVAALPGLVGEERIAAEQARLANADAAVMQGPPGVTHAANLADPADWIDPLSGLAYDSVGADVLLGEARVQNGRLRLASGASYRVLVVPGHGAMMPDGCLVSAPLAERLLAFVKGGGTVILCDRPVTAVSGDRIRADGELRRFDAAVKALWPNELQSERGGLSVLRRVDRGFVVCGPLDQASMAALGLRPDVECLDENERRINGRIAWGHRRGKGVDLYFVANQTAEPIHATVCLRAAGKAVEIWNPLDGSKARGEHRTVGGNRDATIIDLEPYGSRFLICTAAESRLPEAPRLVRRELESFRWKVEFDPSLGGPAAEVELGALVDLSKHEDAGIRYYSGPINYRTRLTYPFGGGTLGRKWLDLGRIANVARVRVNDRDCGTAWTAPYRVEVTGALRPGENELKIVVYNTWANRLTGDARDMKSPIAWTFAKLPAPDAELLPAGLLGPVALVEEVTP